MNKAERMQDMIRYLSDRHSFNLSDLMNKYGISKSTALRDIASLEAMGMPLYAMHGRHGRYELLPNRLLSPILFTLDEIYALYFAMLTLNDFQSTPFHIRMQQLQDKFERCLSPKQLSRIRRMQNMVQFTGCTHPNISRYLPELLESILDNQTCAVIYLKDNRPVHYTVQFFGISSRFGQWYAKGHLPDCDSFQIFRCDKIIELHRMNSSPRRLAQDLHQQYLSLYEGENPIIFEVEIDEKGIDLFYKESYPSMKLTAGSRILIQGAYPPEDEAFIARYFIQYGGWVRAVKPRSLQQAMNEHIHTLARHYEALEANTD